jgi:thiol-disulfide isomerase/thioredoxin
MYFYSFIRLSVVTAFIFLSMGATSQVMDSTFLADQILPRFYVDTGTYLPTAKFVDEAGNEKTLADYKGKILYIDTWATWCEPCIGKFPHQEKLLERLKVLHLDTAIQFVSICYDDKKRLWEKALKKYKPSGVKLFSDDPALGELWNLQTFPTYLLLDTDGKVLGKGISTPDDGGIDYILYAATKGIHPVEAVWNNFRQWKLAYEQKTTDAYTDPDYAKWYAATKQSHVDYFLWKQARQQAALKKKK